MDSRNLDLAAEFCDLVGKPNLLEYLGLPESASPEVLQKKLKARRKYMQGMQSNPKYRAEAIFLIKNFAALNGVLGSPVGYLDDARRRAESQHLPVLEMTIKGVLAGGTLNYDQEDYLRRNALELGVSEATFDSVLERLADAAGVRRAGAGVTVTQEDFQNVDFYRTLGVARHASRDEIYARYRARTEESKAMADPAQRDALRTRVEKAWKVLSDESTRQQYDLSWARTGPPARNRDVPRPIQSSTAPPVQPRTTLPKAPPAAPSADVVATGSVPELSPPRLELLSQRQQRIQLSATPVTVSIEIRNAGEQPLRGTVRSEAPWLKVLQETLDPESRQQSVRVQIDPAAVSGKEARANVTIETERGGREQVEFEVVQPGLNPLLPAMIGGGLALVVLLVAAVYLLIMRDTGFEIHVDPWARGVLIDGNEVGRGRDIEVESPPLGEATVTVRHPNFKAWVKDVVVEAGGELDVELVLDAAMDFQPEPGMKVAELAPSVAVEVMEPFRPGLDACLRSGIPAGESGVVRIFVGPEGLPIGFEMSGQGTESPTVQACVRRQAAGPIFPPLADGQYATVRYDYVIPAR